MKERPASSFAHLLFVQAAVSAKNHSQANSERRGGGGGRVKDNREDELTLWTCQQGKVNRRKGEFPSWTIQIVLLGYQTLLSWYLQRKQKHWTSRTFPVIILSFPFPFFFSLGFIPFSSQNVHPRVGTRPALLSERRAVSFCACHHEHISTRLTSLNE